ncbi:hypothetical protein M5E88_09030 [Akkermansia muciniphila]|nr:hypothetical protein M5E88_09030 [Akkermansia muciniphila]
MLTLAQIHGQPEIFHSIQGKESPREHPAFSCVWQAAIWPVPGVIRRIPGTERFPECASRLKRRLNWCSIIHAADWS